MRLPQYDKTVLLLPFRGNNNGTVFEDLGPAQKTVSRFGDTKTVTAQSQFYGSSAYWDGAGDYLTVANSNDWHIGSQPFLVEFWLYMSEFPTTNQYWGVVGQGNNSPSTHSFMIYFNQSGSILLNFSNGSSLSYPAIGTLSLNTWHHISVSFEPAAGWVHRSLDGVVTSTSYGTFSVPNVSAALEIGRNGTSHFYKGYLQDLHIAKGGALRTENFTPPGRLLGQVGGTITGADGNPVARKIVVFPRQAPQRAVFAESDSNGAYSVWVPSTECSRVVLAQDVGSPGPADPVLPDLIDRVIAQ